ncbi:MAG: peptidoglycan-associated lipoprotein Pal [Pseudomonadota bacterium]
MLRMFDGSRRRALAVIVGAALTVAACARNNEVEGDGTIAPGSAQDFVVNVGDRVFFTVDSSQVNPQAADTLTKQAQWLNLYPQYTILIEGHADERGTREYNIALGARRSVAVRDFLISRGVAANRLQTISYGKERPVAVCNDESCWTQNRRAVSVLTNAGS